MSPKFVFSARTPREELTALPRPSSWFKGPTSKGEERGEEGKERKGREEGDGRDRPPFTNSWIRRCYAIVHEVQK